MQARLIPCVNYGGGSIMLWVASLVIGAEESSVKEGRNT